MPRCPTPSRGEASPSWSSGRSPGGSLAGGPADPAAGLQIEKVRDNLYVLRGGGRTVRIGGLDVPNAGTTVAFVTAGGVVLVDTKLPGWGGAIIEKLRGITDRPVTTIINTHAHFDHVGGNVEFPPAVERVAHESTARLMREMRPVAGGPAQPNIFEEKDGRGLPSRTFRQSLTLGRGDERVEVHHFGRAHTEGDAWVVFPALSVLHAGDVFAYKAVPPLDVNNGASGVEYARTIERAVAALPDIRTVITGHYPTVLTMSDLATYGGFVRGFVDSVQSAKRAGMTIDEFASRWKVPEHYRHQGYADIGHLRPVRSDVEAVWNETA